MAIGEGRKLEISVQNTDLLLFDLSVTKMAEETTISGTADSTVFYFVCPLPTCTPLKFDNFKAANMHIIEKHSSEDGDAGLPKAKKMKIQPATEKAVSVISVSQRIDFAAAKRAVEGAITVTQPTTSVKKEEEAKDKEMLAQAESSGDISIMYICMRDLKQELTKKKKHTHMTVSVSMRTTNSVLISTHEYTHLFFHTHKKIRYHQIMRAQKQSRGGIACFYYFQQ